jgi:hypothetical protein
MQPRTFYTFVILLPAIALAVVLPFAGTRSALAPALPLGATEVWIYPRFALRELAAYGLVALWLLWELRSRTPEAFSRLIWWAPMALVGASLLMMVPFVLVHGAAREMAADQGGHIVLRLIARAAIGYAYVGLAEFVRPRLTQPPTAQPRATRMP